MDEKYDDRTIIGLIERVSIKDHSFLARVDTGATKSSLDEEIANSLNLGPIKGEKTVVNAHGRERRKIISVTVTIGEKIITEDFTITSRTHMKYPVLIGRNILKKGFLIDPNKRSR